MNTIELPAIGDFIRVHKCNSHGREGCIKDINSDVNGAYTITVMTAQSNVLTVVVKIDGDIRPPTEVSDIFLPVPYIMPMITKQITSMIFALPVEICIYKHIKKFDIICIIGSPFIDMIGTVEEIYHGTGWYIVKTPKHCLQLYPTNVELHDQLCIGDFVWVAVH